MKRGFGSDNHSGISPEVLKAISEANINHALAYGDDECGGLIGVAPNGVFVQLPREIWTELQKHYFFYDWDLDNDVVRWLCSFDTTEEDIDKFVEKLNQLGINKSL